jgi:hypothetical protein
MNLKDYAGRYWQWKNGLRFKVLDKPDPQYSSSWQAQCPITGKIWSFNPDNMEGAKELTEEEAKFQPVKIEQEEIKIVMCGTCCGWKCGKEEIRLKMKLDSGKIPSDEQYRVQDTLRDFFRKYNVDGVTPYVYPVDGGIEISFISSKNKEEVEKEIREKQEVWEKLPPERKAELQAKLHELKMDILGGKRSV